MSPRTLGHSVGVGDERGSRRKQHPTGMGRRELPWPGGVAPCRGSTSTDTVCLSVVRARILCTVCCRVCSETRPVDSLAFASPSPYFKGETRTGHRPRVFLRHRPAGEAGPPFLKVPFAAPFPGQCLGWWPTASICPFLALLRTVALLCILEACTLPQRRFHPPRTPSLSLSPPMVTVLPA